MSRAYRIRVRETLRQVIRAEDHVKSQLEILEILPADEMSALLSRELEKQGYQREGNLSVKAEGAVTIAVDLQTGEVTVRAESNEKLDLQGEREGYSYERRGKGAEQAKEQLRRELAKDLQRQADGQTNQLQKQITDTLAAALGDVRQELDKAVNRATAEALKQKAARIGQIKEMHDDPEGGSLTIVVEV